MPQNARKCTTGESIGSTVFLLLFFSGSLLEFLAQSKGASDAERFNCFVAAIVISLVVDVMFGVYAFIASKKDQPAEQRRCCCNSYFARAMIAYWVLLFLIALFNYMSLPTTKISRSARLVCRAVEFVLVVAWGILYITTIERAFRPKEDQNVAAGGVVGGGDAAV